MAGSDSQIPSRGPPNGTIRYIFAWDLDGIERQGNGNWSVTNDLGYRLDVEEAYLVTYQASLVPAMKMGNQRISPPWYERIFEHHHAHGPRGSWGPRRPVCSAILVRRIHDDFGHRDPYTVELKANTRYCDVHYLVSQADFGTENLPLEPELDSVSLILRGSWSHPEIGTMNPITVNVDIAYGALQSSLAHILRPLKTSPVSVGPS